MDTQDTPKIEKKASDKELGVQLLRAEGLKTSAIAKTLGIHEMSVYAIDARLRKLKITGNEKKYKMASKALSSLLQGKTFGELKEVKDSTVAACVKEVYARFDPVVNHNVNVNANIEFSKVDLSAYKGEGGVAVGEEVGDSAGVDVDEAVEVGAAQNRAGTEGEEESPREG